jgi:hypothetical protein
MYIEEKDVARDRLKMTACAAPLKIEEQKLSGDIDMRRPS